ncbi:DUF3786 domain-containing protein [Alkalibaculum sp. M08DMB]|uniref:DUF3786 domain-containing protein n=1 Tax=Alkalibaculum sporogenes TaxID=2655001 RepID=A0A6A7KC77_9FIRM|nr:DUF3786 domain-containing protein [Alkalibaculum sporogenes]MPW26613.1 DUF3786 domain-containing protein [Alkalibaculum sporogenes]
MKPEAVTNKRKDKIPYEYYKEEFKKLNPESICQNSGVEYDSNTSTFKLKLLNDYHYISYPSGNIDEDNPKIKYPLKTLLLRYLINCKDISTSGNMINYKDVPDGNLYYHNFYGRCILRLSKTFKNKIELLISAMEKLNAEKLELGDLSYKIKFLHNIDVYVIIWLGDEEFEASAQILFSDNVPYYFSAEDLAFVGDALNDKLVALAYS